MSESSKRGCEEDLVLHYGGGEVSAVDVNVN